jgi:hypothetical protein
MYGLPLGCLSLAAGSAQAHCATPAMLFVVTAEHNPPVIKSSYTSEELRSLASLSAHRSRHPPLGFYAGTFGYGIEMVPYKAQGCTATVTVRLFLASRLIEVATDSSCRYEVIAEHYLLHSQQDDLLLSRYAAQARDMLDHIEHLPKSEGDVRGARDGVMSSVATALDRLLQPYDEERQRALAGADTDDALVQLAQGCGHAT